MVTTGGVESILTVRDAALVRPALLVAVQVTVMPTVSPTKLVVVHPELSVRGVETFSTAVVLNPTLLLTYQPFLPRVPLTTTGPVITGGVVSTLITIDWTELVRPALLVAVQVN